LVSTAATGSGLSDYFRHDIVGTYKNNFISDLSREDVFNKNVLRIIIDVADKYPNNPLKRVYDTLQAEVPATQATTIKPTPDKTSVSTQEREQSASTDAVAQNLLEANRLVNSLINRAKIIELAEDMMQMHLS